MSRSSGTLLSSYPRIAAEAHGWDPSTVKPHSGKKRLWKCGLCNYEWLAVVANRIRQKKDGCPACKRQIVVPGFNDLATTHPEVAARADGWDPTTVLSGSTQERMWKCPQGEPHSFLSRVSNQARGDGCGVCYRSRLVPGVNDVATKNPLLIPEADGWDPRTVISGTNKKRPWRCSQCGYRWSARVNSRVSGKGCPECDRIARLPQKGINDLRSQFPHVAKEADGWDPDQVTAWSSLPKNWVCAQCSHRWSARVRDRSRGSACPNCSLTGYKKTLPGYVYLMERHGEQQVGITNQPEVRVKVHERAGWALLDLIGPMPGTQACEREKRIKKALKTRELLIPGTHENWQTASLEVSTVTALEVSLEITFP